MHCCKEAGAITIFIRIRERSELLSELKNFFYYTMNIALPYLYLLAAARLGCYSYSGIDPEKFKSDSMIGARIKITSNLSFTPLGPHWHHSTNPRLF